MKKLRITIGKKTYDVTVEVLDEGAAPAAPRQERPAVSGSRVSPAEPPMVAASPGAAVDAGAVVSPMAGVIKTISVKLGDEVQVGTLLAVLEAMKMENQITAPQAGTIKSIDVAVGQSVAEGEVLLTLEA